LLVSQQQPYPDSLSLSYLPFLPPADTDPETGASKGIAFVNFATFEASDAAMAAMDGQYLCSRPISVKYALKKVC
jgi:RNA recognition motif-containing protein